MLLRPTALALLLATVTQAQAQLDPAKTRADCERKLGIPQIAGSGDPVREQQIQSCVSQLLRERQMPAQRPR